MAEDLKIALRRLGLSDFVRIIAGRLPLARRLATPNLASTPSDDDAANAEAAAMLPQGQAATQPPAAPVPDPPRSPPPDVLVPPFDADRAALFLSALAGPVPMAEFIDFVITQILPRDHRSIFWGDRMLTIDKSAGFLLDPAFRSAFEQIHGAHKYDQYNSSVTIAWRLHTLVWAARAALALPEGDFVECGVFQGDMAWMVGAVTNFATSGRQFHLYDSFQGFDPAQTTEEDFPGLPGFLDFANSIYGAEGLWEAVQARFCDLGHFQLHKGYLPGTLERDECPDRIAYLHIDLNVAPVEIACLNHLFDRVVTGGIIVFDDYGWKVFHRQKDAEDAFFAERGYHILELPTGQGLLVKR